MKNIESRDAVLEDENPDRAAGMIQQLAKLRGVGVQSATVLVREGFVRKFANGKALGSYAGLTATPYSSGGAEREQGIGKAGNARLRTVMIELAWLWQRYQPDSAQVSWFRERISAFPPELSATGAADFPRLGGRTLAAGCPRKRKPRTGRAWRQCDASARPKTPSARLRPARKRH